MFWAWWLLLTFWSGLLLLLTLDYFSHSRINLDWKIGTAILVGNAIVATILFFPPIYIIENIASENLGLTGQALSP